MKLTLFQVDAFTDAVFSGNPAAVCPLDRWLDDATMQAIAAENNLAETAFFVRQGDGYGLRWFTPTTEVPLCGHATLASAFVVFGWLRPGDGEVTFETQSGPLTVTRREGGLAMRLPRWSSELATAPEGLAEAMGIAPEEVWTTERDYMLLYPDEASIRALEPDMAALRGFDRACFLATAPGDREDFVLRFFAPRMGIPEDPVTGSAQCGAAPFWAEQLALDDLTCRQVSARTGLLRSRVLPDAVEVTGACALYLKGEISLPG
jgi:PhzF family phenazine biosynthesis protein